MYAIIAEINDKQGHTTQQITLIILGLFLQDLRKFVNYILKVNGGHVFSIPGWKQS